MTKQDFSRYRFDQMVALLRGTLCVRPVAAVALDRLGRDPTSIFLHSSPHHRRRLIWPASTARYQNDGKLGPVT
jgi:hypothetical protein